MNQYIKKQLTLYYKAQGLSKTAVQREVLKDLKSIREQSHSSLALAEDSIATILAWEGTKQGSLYWQDRSWYKPEKDPLEVYKGYSILEQLELYYRKEKKLKGAVLKACIRKDLRRVVANRISQAGYPLAPHHLLDMAFTWGDSPEGFEYWQERDSFYWKESGREWEAS